MEVEQPVARLHRVPHAYVSMSINLIFFYFVSGSIWLSQEDIVYYIFLDTDNIFEIIYSNILVQFQLIISCVYLPLLLMCMPSFLWHELQWQCSTLLVGVSILFVHMSMMSLCPWCNQTQNGNCYDQGTQRNGHNDIIEQCINKISTPPAMWTHATEAHDHKKHDTHQQ
jgi:hypothetical protein